MSDITLLILAYIGLFLMVVGFGRIVLFLGHDISRLRRYIKRKQRMKKHRLQYNKIKNKYPNVRFTDFDILRTAWDIKILEGLTISQAKDISDDMFDFYYGRQPRSGSYNNVHKFYIHIESEGVAAR